MADTNIANMNARLTLSAFEFIHGLEQSEAAALEFANGVEKQGKRAQAAIKSSTSGLNSGGAARAVQQIGFGVQDFASQFETRGLAGGISAVSNNVQMLGAAFGPAGLAASAFGGAIAGIVLPKLIEASGAFEDHTKQLKAYAEAQKAAFDSAKEMSDFRANTLESSLPDIDKQQKKRQAEIDLRTKEIERLTSLQKAQETLGIREREEQDRAWRANGGNMMLPEMFNPAHLTFALNGGKYGAGENELKAKETLKLIQDQTNAVAKLQKMQDEAEKLRPSVADKKANEESEKMEKKILQGRAENERKAAEEIEKFRLGALERYGTAEQKLNSKRARERAELLGKIAGTEGADSVMSQFDRETSVEKMRAQIEKGKKELSELGQDAKGSAGVRRDSVEGIQAINRAITGPGENDIARKQLAVQEKQLEQLEQLARGEKVTAPEQPSSKDVPASAKMKPKAVPDRAWNEGPTTYVDAMLDDHKKRQKEIGNRETDPLKRAEKEDVYASSIRRRNPFDTPLSSRDDIKQLLDYRGDRRTQPTYKKPTSEKVQKMLADKNNRQLRPRSVSENVQKMLDARKQKPQPRQMNDNVAKMLKDAKEKRAANEPGTMTDREQLTELKKITSKPMIAFQLGGGIGH